MLNIYRVITVRIASAFFTDEATLNMLGLDRCKWWCGGSFFRSYVAKILLCKLMAKPLHTTSLTQHLSHHMFPILHWEEQWTESRCEGNKPNYLFLLFQNSLSEFCFSSIMVRALVKRLRQMNHDWEVPGSIPARTEHCFFHMLNVCRRITSQAKVYYYVMIDAPVTCMTAKCLMVGRENIYHITCFLRSNGSRVGVREISRVLSFLFPISFFLRPTISIFQLVYVIRCVMLGLK